MAMNLIVRGVNGSCYNLPSKIAKKYLQTYEEGKVAQYVDTCDPNFTGPAVKKTIIVKNNPLD